MPCACGTAGEPAVSPRRNALLALRLAGALLLWIVLYRSLRPLAAWLVEDLLTLDVGHGFGAALAFFVYDAPKVMMLLVLVVFLVGILRSFLTPERARQLLAGRRESAGNVLAATLGVATPFCTCSAVPLFIGFVTAGIPLGVTFSFLVSAPMVNEVALVLLFSFFSWKVASLYMATGLAVAILAGWIIGRLGMEAHVEDWVREIGAGTSASLPPLRWNDRILYGAEAVKDVVLKVWPFIVGGIAVGALIHGYIPQSLLSTIMGKEAWWSVPAAVAVGIPMYANCAGALPVIQALLGKGAPLGTSLAFLMAVVGLSLPEMIILRRVLKPRLIAVFVGVVGTGILLVGYLFNAVV